MLFSNASLLFLATLLASATAAPAPQEPKKLFPDDGIYRWKVISLFSDCPNVPDCEYKFNIKGDNFEKDGLKTPAFSAACAGKKENETFVACTFDDGAAATSNRSLGSRLEPSPITDERGKVHGSLIISYEFTDALNQAWNYTNNLVEINYLGLGAEQNFNIEVPAPVKVTDGVSTKSESADDIRVKEGLERVRNFALDSRLGHLTKSEK
ncbi:hypothetical protein HYFRA_00006627 [Hymenoscyphus fraxineus]|uniref:Uncharacterized protein n=1 Tax=Hymenoscyphus fraxineus TaxID=746836 RepID=A0A9N9PTQ1_9HELO|nr:hypothetical protein HYFRA_00006627 [Hymenoscyphus fraxineus]